MNRKTILAVLIAFTIGTTCWFARAQYPLSLLFNYVTPSVTSFVTVAMPYIQHPTSIITQLNEHKWGYGIIAGVTGTLTSGILKFLFKRAKTKAINEVKAVTTKEMTELTTTSTATKSQLDLATVENTSLKEQLDLSEQMISKYERLETKQLLDKDAVIKGKDEEIARLSSDLQYLQRLNKDLKTVKVETYVP